MHIVTIKNKQRKVELHRQYNIQVSKVSINYHINPNNLFE